jgi:hypothetical protein
MADKKYKRKKQTTEAKEPAAVYGKHQGDDLVFFNSFEEMNEYDIKGMGDSTPKKRFQNITYLLQNLYADVLKTKVTDRELHFK